MFATTMKMETGLVFAMASRARAGDLEMAMEWGTGRDVSLDNAGEVEEGDHDLSPEFSGSNS